MTLQEIKKQVSAINSDFDIDTGSQSFVVYPTNYIDLVFDQYSITVGQIVYGRIDTYPIFEQIGKVVSFMDKLNLDHIFKVMIDGCNGFDFTLYTFDLDDDLDMQSFSCDDVDDLLLSIKREVEALF